MAFEQLPVVPPSADTEVMDGAEPVHPEDWPATLIFLTQGGGCTSTLVGSDVILTAAHCIGNGETGTIVAGGEEVSVTCDHHPDFRKGHADFALCLIGGEITSVPYEVIGTALAHAQKDDLVILSGYGCVETGGRDRSFGTLHVGTATVTETPTQENLHNTVTMGAAALCYGDSGGPAYFDAGDGERLIIGVNSQGDLNKKSVLASTATLLFVDWAFKWAKGKNVEICGLHVGTRGCRS